MIGMTLSLISILAMLALYKNMVGISVRSIQDAQQDGQVSAGFLTAQLEMRNAGFGMDLPISNSIVLLAGATLTNNTLRATNEYPQPVENTGNALVWVSQLSSTVAPSCAGLLAQDGQLFYLKGASSCTEIAHWRTTNWTSTVLVAAPKSPTDDSNYGNLQPAGFFKTESAPCWPFGKTETLTNRLKVIMTASISAKDSAGNAVKSVSEICLPNLPTS